jgi:hypothetical protein
MPNMQAKSDTTVQIDHPSLGRFYCHLNESPGPIEPVKRGRNQAQNNQPVIVDESVTPELMFTHNETNFHRLYGGDNKVPYVKDAFHDHIILDHRPSLPKSEQPDEQIAPIRDEDKIEGRVVVDSTSATDDKHIDAMDRSRPSKIGESPKTVPAPLAPEKETPKWPHFINPNKEGTKFGANYVFKQVPGNGGCCVVRLKITNKNENEDEACYDEEMFDDIIAERKLDADEFYSRFNSGALTNDLQSIMRQALGGMLW